MTFTNDLTVVRDYHNLEFYPIQDGETDSDEYALNEIAKIILAELKPQLSRAIIFINSRRKCEVYSERLSTIFSQQEREDLTVGYYHAGMPSERRSLVEEQFRKGEKAIIFATKAFGMGVDIPNIHFVFHQRPPSNLENYLQEIGRAGRNAESRLKAGISKVRCVLFYNEKNFAKTREKMLNSRWHWTDIEAMRQVISDYCQRQGDESKSAFIIPTDLIKESKVLWNKKDPETTQKMLLYWLERLGKVSLGDRLVSHVNLSLGENPKKAPVALLQLIEKKGGTTEKYASILISELQATFGVNSSKEVFNKLFKEHGDKTISFQRNLRIKMTNFGREEIDKDKPIGRVYKKAYRAIDELLKNLQYQNTISSEIIEAVLQKQSNSLVYETNAEHQKLAKNRLLKSGAKIIRFLNKLDGIKIIDSFNGVKKVFTSSSSSSDDWQKQLKTIREFTEKILTLINEKNQQEETVNVGDLIKVAAIDNYDLLNIALSWLQSLGYLRYEQDVIPTSLQVRLNKGFENPIHELKMTELEREVKRDFDNYYFSNEWRLNALEALAEIEGEAAKKSFIGEYFNCQNAVEIQELILNKFPENSALGAKLRQTAFEEEMKKLNEEQKAMVKDCRNSSLIVAAGPGSGKTRTLLMCVANLIVKYKEVPSNILVLAYNAAVVTELKTRLSKLLRELGYASSYNSLPIYTFHGYVRRCFGRQLPENCKVEDYLKYYLEVTETNKSFLRPGDRPAPHYVFIDEYQDTNRERYEILLRIKGDNTKAIAIGDDDQSIYGYERKKAGEAMSSRPYFDRFGADFRAARRYLTINYRSGTQILNRAQDYIGRNSDRLRSDRLDAGRESSGVFLAEKVIKADPTKQTQQLLGAIAEILKSQNLQSASPSNISLQSVAILFRTNAELYRVLEPIRNRFKQKAQIRVQGDKERFASLREVAVLLDELREQGDRPIGSFAKGFLQEVREIAWKLCQSHRPWDDNSYYLLAAAAWSFAETYSSDTPVAEFVRQIEDVRNLGELTLLYKQYQREYRQKTKPELLLSTIHKIKGLEFDAVLIPAADRTQNIVGKESIEEERRLQYVAMTRARDYLHLIEGDREDYLFQGRDILKHNTSQFGLAFDSSDGYEENSSSGGKGMVTLFRYASDSYARENPLPGKTRWTGADLQKLIFEEVGEGDRLELVWDDRQEYYHIHHPRLQVNIGTITSKNSGYIRNSLHGKDRLQGLAVTSVARFRDAKYNSNLCNSVLQRGYYYIVNITGYLK
jgi:ATP-dependent DNA helicase RecQ